MEPHAAHTLPGCRCEGRGEVTRPHIALADFGVGTSSASLTSVCTQGINLTVGAELDRDGQCPSNPRRYELLCCYASVLRTTQVHARSLLGTEAGQAWAGDRLLLWQPVQEFCARILGVRSTVPRCHGWCTAISFFRLPEIHSLVCAALSGVQAISLSAKQEGAPSEEVSVVLETPATQPLAAGCCYYRQADLGFELMSAPVEAVTALFVEPEEPKLSEQALALQAASEALARAEAAEARAIESPVKRYHPD